jgi:hypothetical protein
VSYQTVIGIDPGLEGGVAIISPKGAVAHNLPVADGGVDAWSLGQYFRSCGIAETIVVLESVHSMPHQGVASAFTFGKGFGTIVGACGALGIRMELVTPQAWKKIVLPGLIPAKPKLPPDATPAQKKIAKAAHKKAGKDAAIGWCRRAYPMVDLIPEGCRTPHDGRADALCIAEYARLKFACS